MFKVFETQKFLGPNKRKFLKNFQIFHKNYLGLKNFKCIEFNSERQPKLILFFGFGSGPDPRLKPKTQRDPSQNV